MKGVEAKFFVAICNGNFLGLLMAATSPDEARAYAIDHYREFFPPEHISVIPAEYMDSDEERGNQGHPEAD